LKLKLKQPFSSHPMPTLAQLILSAFDSARTGYCGNRDGYIELGELLCACAPDVNNDGALDAREKALGLPTATAWVATILKECPRALDDGRISLAELGSVVVAGGEPLDRRRHEDLFARAEGMLRRAMH
jgi:hypothetical protein